MPKTAKEKELLSFDIWFDPTSPDIEYSREAIFERMKSVHGIDPKTTKFKREMTMHMDSSKWFQSNYTYTAPDGKIFYNQIRCRRTGINAQMWRDG